MMPFLVSPAPWVRPVLAGRELQALGETPCLAQVRVVVVRVLAFPFGAGLLVYFSGGPGDGVDLAFLGLVLFAGFEQVAHVGDRVEGLAGVDVQAVLEDVVGQVVDERGERGQQAAFGFGPERRSGAPWVWSRWCCP